MIELINFSKSYNKNSFAVENISFSINKGSITGLLGSNGSGKTTILKAICGFHYPTSGKILLLTDSDTELKSECKAISVEENPETAMKLIGYVPEIPNLPQDMYVLEFLEYAAETHFLDKPQTEAAIKRVTEQCSLSKFINKKIKTLSKGQQQRVSFAQALIHDPENLILDEPISGLDPAQIKQMRTLIKELSKTKAVLMSTHILHEISELCSEVYILNKGSLIKAKNLNNLEQEFIQITEEE